MIKDQEYGLSCYTGVLHCVCKIDCQLLTVCIVEMATYRAHVHNFKICVMRNYRVCLR